MDSKPSTGERAGFEALVNRRGFLAHACGASAALSCLGGSARATTSAAQQIKAAAQSSIQVLAFDTFGTVVDWRSSVIAEGQQIGKTRRLTVDWPAFADAWRDGYAPSMERVRNGGLPWTKLDTLHRMTLDELLRRFNIEGLSEEDKARFNRVWHRLRPWPDSVDGLRRMKMQFVVSTLSNGNVSLLTNLAKYAQLPWDCILSAELVRHYKPDPETYQMVPEIFDLKPSQVMMVAAHEGDLEAAAKVGLKTAYVHRPAQYGSGRISNPPPIGRFDIIARDFHDLAAKLGA